MAQKKLTKNKKNITSGGNYTDIVLEKVFDEVKLIGEQHGDIIKKINSLDDRIVSLDKSLSNKIDNLEISLNKKIDDFKNDTKANFNEIQKYLSRIDDEYMTLRGKVGMLEIGQVKHRDWEWIKNKVLVIEKQLKDFKKRQTAFAAKL